MKRQGNLWDRMISFENLLLAAHAAARGKRFKPGVARFVFDLERQLLLLHNDFSAGDDQTLLSCGAGRSTINR